MQSLSGVLSATQMLDRSLVRHRGVPQTTGVSVHAADVLHHVP
jgi:hypothetical protein